MIYDMIYLTAIGFTHGGSSTVHIYIQTIHRTTQSTQTIRTTTQFNSKIYIMGYRMVENRNSL